MEHPVTTNVLISGISERYEIVIDLSAYAGKTIHVRNAKDFSRNEDFAKTDYVMQIKVGTKVTDTTHNGPVPSDLVKLNFPTDTGSLVHRHFLFGRSNSEWRINGIGFKDVKNRIMAKPIPGSTEIWELENSSGGWGMYQDVLISYQMRRLIYV